MPLRALALGPKPLTLAATTSVREALAAMIGERVNHAAVVDGQGRFVGLASADVALARLIPTSAATEHGLADLAFVGDALPMLQDHYRKLLDLPATELIDPHIQPLASTTPMMEAALLLSRAHGPLPVVDAAGALVGILSQRTLLQFLHHQAGG